MSTIVRLISNNSGIDLSPRRHRGNAKPPKMKILTILALVASVAAVPDPMITSAPKLPARQANADEKAKECDAKLVSLRQNSPQILSYPGILPWFGEEMSKAVLTQTPDFNLCDEIALSEKVTPPPSLAGAWSTWRNEHNSWVSAHRSEALSLASSCGEGVRSFQIAGAVVTDKAECESLYKKQMGSVPTLPKITQSFPRLTDTRGGTFIGVWTTVTPGGKTEPTTTGAGQGGSGNAAAPKETGSLFAAAVAMVGVLAAL